MMRHQLGVIVVPMLQFAWGISANDSFLGGLD